MLNFFLTFSDSAKFAQAAINFLSGRGLIIRHSFFDPGLLASYNPGDAFKANFLPLIVYVYALLFKLFPAADNTLAWGGIFVWLLISFISALIALKLHSRLAALVTFFLLIGNLYFFDYARNFTSDLLFALQIVLFVFLAIQPRLVRFLSLIPLAFIFLTRQQAPVFLVAVLLFLSLSYLFFSSVNTRLKIALTAFLSAVGITYLLASFIFPDSLFSFLRLLGAAGMEAGVSQGNYLRGVNYSVPNPKDLLVKIFYNLYNFARSPERIISPLIIPFYLFSLFIKPSKLAPRFSWFTFLTLILFLFAASATLPNARYVHPVVPLLLISASIALVEVSRLIDSRFRSVFLALVVSLAMLPALGKFTLDARFDRSRYNLGRPPVYQVIAKELHDRVPKDQLVITNLDAWGSWYYGSTTMWFPLSPDLLKDHRDKVKYIFITNYLENDGDFALGEWAEVVYRPESIANSFLKDNYTVADTFVIPAAASYHNQEIKATLLIRRD